MRKLTVKELDDMVLSYLNPQPVLPLVRGAVEVPAPGQKPNLQQIMNRTKPKGV